MAMFLDITKTASQNIFALIQTLNPNIYVNSTSVALGIPQVLNPPVNGKNTRLTLSAIPGQGFKGTQDIFYNRVALTNNNQIATFTVLLSLLANPDAVRATIVSQVAQRFKLRADQLVLQGTLPVVLGSKTMDIVPIVNCLVYVGSVSIVVQAVL